MADNNNTGNPINNGYRNTSSDSNQSTDLSSVVTVLGNVASSLDNLAKQFKASTTKSGNKNVSDLTEKELQLAIKKAVDSADYSKSLEKLSDLQDTNAKEFKRLTTALGSDLEKYKKLIEESNSLISELKKTEITLDARKTQAENLKKKADKTEEEKKQLDVLNKEIEDLERTIEKLNDKQTKVKNKLDSEDMKGVEKILDSISDNGSTNNKLLRQHEKRRIKREKDEDKLDIQIGNKLASSFDGGIFNLGKNLTSGFSDIKNSFTNNLSQQGLLGKLVGFAVQSINSAIAYETQLMTKGIDTLQASFETTGISISRAVLTDKDEVAKQYEKYAEWLNQMGLAVSFTTSEFMEFDSKLADMGIRDQETRELYTEYATMISAETGSSILDFTDKEFAQYLNSAIIQGEAEGKTKEDVIADVMNIIGTNIGNASELGGGLGLSQGQAQEIALETMKLYATQNAQAGRNYASIAATNKALFTSIGAGGIADTLNNTLLNPLSTGMNLDSLAALISKGSAWDKKAVKDALQSQDQNALADLELSILENVFNTDNTKLLQTLYPDYDAQELELIKKTYTDNFEEFSTIFKDFAGNISTSNIAAEKANELYRTKTEYIAGVPIYTSGVTTTEKGLENYNQNLIAGQWSEAEQTHIPQAADLLKDTINAGSELIQTAIAGAADFIVSALVGSNALGGVINSLGGIGGALSAAGPIAVAVVGATAVGLTIKSVIDAAGDSLFTLTDEEVAEENARNIGKEVAEKNAEKNKETQKNIAAQLEDIQAIRKDTKEVTALMYDKDNHGYDIETTTDAATDITNKREAVGTSVTNLLDTLSSDKGVLEYQGDKKIHGGVYGKGSVLYYDSDKGTYQIASDTSLRNSRTISESEIADMFTSEDLSVNDDFRYTALNESGVFSEGTTKGIQEAGNTVDATQELYNEGLTTDSDKIANSLFWDVYQNYQDSLFSNSSTDYLTKAVNAYGSELTDNEKQTIINDVNERLNTIRPNYEKYTQAKYLKEVLTKLNSEGIMSIKDAKQAIKLGEYEKIDAMANKLLYTRLAGNYIELFPYIDFNSDSLGDLALQQVDKFAEVFTPESVAHKLAVGIDYVPYDNYPTLLHRGERVETAAEARMEDLVSELRYNLENNNLNDNYDYIEQLNTTNNSIDDGFTTTSDNLTTIIEALKVIINTMSYNKNKTTPFSSLSDDIIAKRSNNVAVVSSLS